MRVYPGPGERYGEEYIRTVAFGGRLLTIWGGINSEWK